MTRRNRVWAEPIWTIVATVAFSAVVTLVGEGIAFLFLIVGALAGAVLYIRVADWLAYRRARPDLARPLLPGRRQGGLANGDGGATMGYNRRKQEDRG